jgi:hypothetical protein
LYRVRGNLNFAIPRQQLLVVVLDQFGGFLGEQLSHRPSNDLGSWNAKKDFSRAIGKDIAQTMRILGKDRLRHILDYRQKKSFSALKILLNPALFCNVLMGCNPSSPAIDRPEMRIVRPSASLISLTDGFLSAILVKISAK